MKIYRATRRFGNGFPVKMRFSTSLAKAKKLIEVSNKSKIEIHVCKLQTNLTAKDWIKLLEGDAPGVQEPEKTPVDFLEVGARVWVKRGKEAY